MYIPLILITLIGALNAFENGIDGLYTGVKTTTMIMDNKREVYKAPNKRKEIYAQLVDDINGVTLASVSSRSKEIKASTKAEASAAVGKAIAEKATKVGVETVAFDRNGYLYHGRVKVLADAAREAGLKF